MELTKKHECASGLKTRSMCGISCLLDIFGDKWSLLIVRDLMFWGKKTYSDFLSSDEKIATNILANRLILLEENGIITKEEYPGNKVKNLYKLTPKGIKLMPVLIEMLLWSDEYYLLSEKGRMFAKKIRKNRDLAIKSVVENLTK
jgi:DNA-binding HxlR family transcriptional regulator